MSTQMLHYQYGLISNAKFKNLNWFTEGQGYLDVKTCGFIS